MDLSSMLNDGPGEEKKSSGSQSSPPARGNAMDNAPSTSASQARGRGLTPLQTPSQSSSGGQYPFPGPQQPYHPQQQQQQSHPAQSPGSGPPHRPYDAYTATTPGGRPASQTFQFAQPSPSQQYQPNPHAHQTMSMSPTLSHHSQTPHSVRQSPMATSMGYPPPLQQQQSYPPPFHQSQPSTPLGPPPPMVGRHPTQSDMSSPYHQRTYSGASNGMIAGSPAQHNLSIGNLLESPSANHHRPSSSARRSTSDYMSSADRERSLSVSPKTKIPARQPSSGSRHSSQQESYSARSSVQPGASVASQMGTPGRVPAAAPNYAQPPVTSGMEDSLSGRNGNHSNLPQSQPLPVQHQPQKMDMHHLLSPTQHEPQSQSQPGPGAAPQNSQYQHQHQILPHSQPPPQNHSLQNHPQQHQQNHAPQSNPGMAIPAASRPPASNSIPPLKRAAESPPVAEPASKRGRGKKYSERPIWAHLHKDNPRANEPGVVPNSAQQSKHLEVTSRPQHTQPAQMPPQQQNGQHAMPQMHPQPQTNGSGPHDAPLDKDLIRARSLVDPAWEKSMAGGIPISSVVKHIMDWLYVSLDANSDIGLDPRHGAIEIEAKIGTLIDKQSGDRIYPHTISAAVLDPQSNDRYQFESQMAEPAHKRMNNYLNTLAQSAAKPGRTKITYTHTRQTDSFRTLNKAGLDLMPEALMKRHMQQNGARTKDINLRTTTNDEDGKVVARIVKLNLCSLQICSPRDSYDVRISMNIEVNLNQPDINTEAITVTPTQLSPAAPNRRKDRVSYKHLAYQTDLTRVDMPGLGPKYELELEVDADTLRRQKQLLAERKESGFQDVVEGFVDNLMLLMRQPRQ